jgi:multiple sugar transport system substrate-binding protein
MARVGRALTAGLLLATIGAVSACADRPGTAAPITLVFKHAHILGQGNPIPKLIAEFEARHPGVHVQAEALPWNSDEQRQFFVINLEGDSPGFDVMMLDVIWVPEFARAGWLLDLTPKLAPDELAAFFPSTVEAATYGGRVWGMPWNMNVGLLYYRRDLLDKYGLAPPATWTDLVAQAERIRAAERNPRLDGILWQGKQYEGLMVNVLEGLWADGTDLLGEGGAIFPDPARAEAVLAFMRGLITRGVSPPWTTAADEELTRRAFGQGEAVFLRNWPYALDLLERGDSPVRGRVGVAPLPRHRDGARGAGSTGGSHLAIHRGTRHPDLALELVRALASESAQRLMVTGAALYPTRVALYHAPDLVRAQPALPAIAALTLGGRPRPVTPYYVTISTLLQPELSAAIVGVKAPARAVADARRAVGFVLRDVRAAAPGVPR